MSSQLFAQLVSQSLQKSKKHENKAVCTNDYWQNGINGELRERCKQLLTIWPVISYYARASHLILPIILDS